MLVIMLMFFRSVEKRVMEGKCAVVYTTPEKLQTWTRSFCELAKKKHLTCIAIDEAHCVSEWVKCNKLH